MKRKIKMILWGEPGTGKSVFSVGAPKPFFLTSDPNYEWLEDFGADPDAHVQLTGWGHAKKEFAKPYDEYETLVVDLAEDLFKWSEKEYCKKNGLEFIGDAGYGKGYNVTRDEFVYEISKLLGKDKNIILIMHGYSYATQDRRGKEHVMHRPTNRIPDIVLDQIEGQVRLSLRAYVTAEADEEGKLVKKRKLSFIPKENENYSVNRLVDENSACPTDIELDWNTLVATLDEYRPHFNFANKNKEKENEEKQKKVEQEITNNVENTVIEKEEKPEVKELSASEKLELLKQQMKK